MCLVLDTNMFGKFLKKADKDMQPIYSWLNKGRGKIIYTKHASYYQELAQSQNMLRWLDDAQQSGQSRLVDLKKVEQAASKLRNKIKNGSLQLKSNDIHILALAQASRVKLLCSDDRGLHADFTNPQIVGGKVYQNQGHKRLLTKDLCP